MSISANPNVSIPKSVIGEFSNSRIITLLPILLRLLGILVKLTRITSPTLDRGHIWRIDILLDESLPRHLREPGVVLDVRAPAVQVAKTLRQVGRDELN